MYNRFSSLITGALILALVLGTCAFGVYFLDKAAEKRIQDLESQEFDHIFGFALPATKIEKPKVARRVLDRLKKLQAEAGTASEQLAALPSATRDEQALANEEESASAYERLRCASLIAAKHGLLAPADRQGEGK